MNLYHVHDIVPEIGTRLEGQPVFAQVTFSYWVEQKGYSGMMAVPLEKKVKTKCAQIHLSSPETTPLIEWLDRG